ncbi:hypothetical protein E2C01_076887 [Portunus trituberculatus]|uniref:Uncharacterized protein n=1 Tax=Portunus trituberculatus TaxID=210409 RepID=A0A5B7IPV5_PORTR|nr:hypothetical protein [Portunus trituberculatus]
MVASGGVRGTISQIREAVITCSFRVDGSSPCVRRLAKGTPPTPRHAEPGTVIRLALLPSDTATRLMYLQGSVIHKFQEFLFLLPS